MEEPTGNLETNTPTSPRSMGSSGLEHTSDDAKASSGGAVLGPDGREAAETWGDLSSGLTGLVEKNPMIAAVASLALGLVVGMIVGAAVARD